MAKDSAERATPPWVIPWLTHECGVHIWLDVCATQHNAVCDNYLTVVEDGLEYDWRLTSSQMREARGPWERSYYAWMNPPYSRGQLNLWIAKAINEWRYSRVQTIALLPQDMSTRWANLLWHTGDACTRSQEPRYQIIYLCGRLHFEQMSTGAKFPSMLVVIGNPLPRRMPMVTRVNTRELKAKWTPKESF